ncbi:uncharacterized protein LOC117109049 [Anneissia japonica]|uniref:uncharacterized protein LOC117109049 n=1 Tax=Anneissia japonica TaxID=1529436 RepID=UPI0014256162|nr:uncharacterized protein LOC117109049 [Anneissia japonica]
MAKNIHVKNVYIIIALILVLCCIFNKADTNIENTRQDESMGATDIHTRGMEVIRSVGRLVDLVDEIGATSHRALKRNQDFALYAAAQGPPYDGPFQPQGWRRKRRDASNGNIMDITLLKDFDEAEKTFETTFHEFLNSLEKIHYKFAQRLEIRTD